MGGWNVRQSFSKFHFSFYSPKIYQANIATTRTNRHPLVWYRVISAIQRLAKEKSSISTLWRNNPRFRFAALKLITIFIFSRTMVLRNILASLDREKFHRNEWISVEERGPLACSRDIRSAETALLMEQTKPGQLIVINIYEYKVAGVPYPRNAL